ncbi:LysR family transcriptional regulator [Stenotrophomonas sp.]|uniref:LysR family transcriptional regulator n=1 Tax=Stenotrophomonas sp. TaxID=69392 RepID=UPI0028A69B09|nr:LysR family transcriptional regulator [Stenotrophomonas sp.]
MDRLQAIKVVIGIADHGGLSAAARALGMSTPAVVRALAALELKLGARLFNRTTRRVALTPEGARYVASVRPLLLALDAADLDVKDASGAPAGDLVITAPVMLGQQYVGPIATAFAASHPGVRCELRLDDGLVDLVQDGVDLGVRIGRLTDSSLVAIPLTTTRQVVVGSPAILDRHGTPLHPTDLVAAPCVETAVHGRREWVFRQQHDRLSIGVSGSLSVNHVATAVQACVAGAGFGQFYSYQVADHLRSGALAVVLEQYELEPVPVQVVYPHARHLPHRSRLFVEALKHGMAGIDTLAQSGPSGVASIT